MKDLNIHPYPHKKWGKVRGSDIILKSLTLALFPYTHNKHFENESGPLEKKANNKQSRKWGAVQTHMYEWQLSSGVSQSKLHLFVKLVRWTHKRTLKSLPKHCLYMQETEKHEHIELWAVKTFPCSARVNHVLHFSQWAQGHILAHIMQAFVTVLKYFCI